jgi:hypothetical protein
MKNKPNIEDITREELYELAQNRDIPGRSGMDKEQLYAAVYPAEAETPEPVAEAEDSQAAEGGSPLVEALRFYADPASYARPDRQGGIYRQAPAFEDAGAKARAALGI